MLYDNVCGYESAAGLYEDTLDDFESLGLEEDAERVREKAGKFRAKAEAAKREMVEKGIEVSKEWTGLKL